jgi:hypothetical protein
MSLAARGAVERTGGLPRPTPRGCVTIAHVADPVNTLAIALVRRSAGCLGGSAFTPGTTGP